MWKMIFRASVIFLALATAGVLAKTVFASSEGKTGEDPGPQSSTAYAVIPSPALAPGSPVSPSGASFITDVIEGDKMLLSTGEWVQLIGVDAPDPINPASAKEATAFIKKIRDRKKDRKKVRLEYYVEAKDRYTRTPAYVYRVSDELLLIAETDKQGRSRAYAVFPLKHMGELKKYEQEDGTRLWLYKLTPKSTENEGMIAEIQSLTEDQKKSVLKYIAGLKHPDPDSGKENGTPDTRDQEILYSGLSKQTGENLKKAEEEAKAQARAQAKKAAAAKLEENLKQLTAAQQVIFKEVKTYEEAGEPCIDVSFMQNSYRESLGNKIKSNKARESFRNEVEILKEKGFVIEKPNETGSTCLKALK
jgi:hypothetical protein